MGPPNAACLPWQVSDPGSVFFTRVATPMDMPAALEEAFMDERDVFYCNLAGFGAGGFGAGRPRSGEHALLFASTCVRALAAITCVGVSVRVPECPLRGS
jgi:hypothetical protein